MLKSVHVEVAHIIFSINVEVPVVKRQFACSVSLLHFPIRDKSSETACIMFYLVGFNGYIIDREDHMSTIKTEVNTKFFVAVNNGIGFYCVS